MRKQNDQTRYNPLDLADMPRGSLLLRFEAEGFPATVLWVDEIQVKDTHISAYRYGDDEDTLILAATFSPSYKWFVLDASLVETFTLNQIQSQMMEDSKAQLKQYLETKKVLEEVKDEAERWPGDPPPKGRIIPVNENELPSPDKTDWDDELKRWMEGGKEGE